MIPELDRLPLPARELFPASSAPDLDAYWDGFCQLRPAIQLHASRGCPFRCSFCLWTQVMYSQGQYRTFSPARVVDEMVDVRDRFHAQEVYFDDDTFVGRRRHVEGICDELERRGISDLAWSCMGDAVVPDADLIDRMAACGCIGMKFGVESASAEVLRRVGKPAVLLDRVNGLARRLAHHRIKSHATFTFGLPGETRESMRATFELACRLDVDMVQFSITTPFPGTRYHDELAAAGLLGDTEAEAFDGAQTAVADLPGLPASEIGDYARAAHGRWLLAKCRAPRWVLRQVLLLGRVLRGQGVRGVVEKASKAWEVVSRAAGVTLGKVWPT